MEACGGERDKAPSCRGSTSAKCGGFPLPPRPLHVPSSHFSASPSRMLDNNRIATIVPATFAGLKSLYFL